MLRAERQMNLLWVMPPRSEAPWPGCVRVSSLKATLSKQSQRTCLAQSPLPRRYVDADVAVPCRRCSLHYAITRLGWTHSGHSSGTVRGLGDIPTTQKCPSRVVRPG